MGIQWELKGKASTNFYDASVYLIDKGKKTDISIKNEFWKYFREDKKGYAVMRSGSKNRVYFHMAAPHKDFVGDYDVYFDPELKMYYISRRDKE